MHIYFYNLRVGRSNKQVARELQAMLSRQPHVVGLCEAVGYQLPAVPGYTLVRDTSTPSRANVACYVRDDQKLRRVRWVDLTQSWGRTQHQGEHPARSFVSMLVAGTQVIVAHQAPKGTDNTVPAQEEGLAALAQLMAPWQGSKRVWRHLSRFRQRVVIMDANRTVHDQGPGPAELARRIDGSALPVPHIDTAVFRNGVAHTIAYPTTVAGVRLESDHRHALRFSLDR